jgi:hypothetical protein
VSDAGRAYVERHSPYKGDFFLIHLRLGNIENDTYNHRLFIADLNLAKLCRCSTKTVQRAKDQMVRDGFLRQLKPAVGQRVAEFEFLFPKTQVNIQMEPIEEDGQSVEEGGQSVLSGWTSREPSPTNRNKEEIKHVPTVEREFEEVWRVYPRKLGKAQAKKAFVARRRAGVTHESLLRATVNYGNVRSGQDPTRTMGGQRFFGNEGDYLDYLPGGEGLNVTPKPRTREKVDDEVAITMMDLDALFTNPSMPVTNPTLAALLQHMTVQQIGRMNRHDVTVLVRTKILDH